MPSKRTPSTKFSPIAFAREVYDNCTDGVKTVNALVKNKDWVTDGDAKRRKRLAKKYAGRARRECGYYMMPA